MSVGVTRWIPWKTEVSASAALLFQHNGNDAGQPRETRGQRFELGLSRRLYLKGDVTRLTGLARVSYLGFRTDLDVGAYDPLRQTTEEIGLDGRWVVRPRWEAFATAMAGAQQERERADPRRTPWRRESTGRSAPRGESPSAVSSTIRAPPGGEGGIAARAGIVRLRVPF